MPATDSTTVRLVTLDPGHFHAALVQKSMYPNVDSVVHVYAPAEWDLQQHLERINLYNTRPESPTKWATALYTGDDFMDKMLSEKKGNVVVMSGNNRKKTEYILRAVESGFHVLADKPMAISKPNFEVLKRAFDAAKKNDVLLYDIMTERYEITTMLQREFSLVPAIFGNPQNGTPEDPAVTKESVHHFYKYVSGSVLTRPAWFFDVQQQGEGIVDVTTHLVDLVQWECFPEKIIDYEKDVDITSVRRWSTDLTLDQFKQVTKLNDFPDYLRKDVSNGMLRVFSNGEINYRLKGIHSKVSVIWAYQAPEGTGDTHYSIMRGTKANLIIRQGKEQQYRPALYIEPLGTIDEVFKHNVKTNFGVVQSKYPGIELKENQSGFEVIIPEKYKEGHEAHFARVMEKFLGFLQQGSLPEWEVPNMLAKYYTTTTAYEMAQKNSAQR